jgi:hypothetical protein
LVKSQLDDVEKKTEPISEMEAKIVKSEKLITNLESELGDNKNECKKIAKAVKKLKQQGEADDAATKSNMVDADEIEGVKESVLKVKKQLDEGLADLGNDLQKQAETIKKQASAK